MEMPSNRSAQKESNTCPSSNISKEKAIKRTEQKNLKDVSYNPSSWIVDLNGFSRTELLLDSYLENVPVLKAIGLQCISINQNGRVEKV